MRYGHVVQMPQTRCRPLSDFKFYQTTELAYVISLIFLFPVLHVHLKFLECTQILYPYFSK
jgi:hypothetical protein